MLNSNVDLKSYLSFNIGNECFAINAKSIHSIIEVVNITKMPNMPEFMLGIINLRESAIPVIDTRVQFGMETSSITANSCIIILEAEIDGKNLLFGNLVDGVSEVIEIEKEKILPNPDLGGKYKGEFIKGVISYNDKFIMILDIQEIFENNGIESIARVA